MSLFLDLPIFVCVNIFLADCTLFGTWTSSLELGMGFWVEVRFPTPLRLQGSCLHA